LATEKLYYTDTYLKEFTAGIVRAEQEDNGNWGIVLDTTAFYPEGGGQPSDTGWLDDIPVLTVREKQGEVVHITAGKPAGPTVKGRIDWNRRFDHMQQHSGEHLLSGVFGALFGAENVGFHLGADSVYIDVTVDTISPEQAAAAEDAANAYIFANQPVKSAFVAEGDLDKYPLRKRPAKSYASIRLVTIDGVDCCPCGGTHVATTGEIGLVKIRTWERRNGAVRVDFVCGGRALADYRLTNNVARELSSRLSVPVAELPAALQRQQTKAEAMNKELSAAKQQLNKYLAAALYAEGGAIGDARLIARGIFEVGPADLADLARQVVATGPSVVLLAAASAELGKSQLVFACSPGLAFDMGALLKKVLPAIGGKGGGNANFAQGGAGFGAKLDDALELARQEVLKIQR
jgi:alanyl-tRNA synthetase